MFRQQNLMLIVLNLKDDDIVGFDCNETVFSLAVLTSFLFRFISSKQYDLKKKREDARAFFFFVKSNYISCRKWPEVKYNAYFARSVLIYWSEENIQLTTDFKFQDKRNPTNHGIFFNIE